MKKGNNNQKLAQRWFDKANDDLLFAKAGWQETKISGNTCFLCQQAAEKYLKGFLVSQSIKPPYVHNLLELLNRCIEINKEFTQFIEKCEVLNSYYIPPRYPADFSTDYSQKEVKEAFKIVEEIADFVCLPE